MSARRLLRRPTFTACAVLLIGLAAGTSIVVGQLTHATVLKGLPYGRGRTLVALRWSSPELGIPDMALSLVESKELASRTDAFEGLSATLTPIPVSLLRRDGPSHLTAGLATPGSFDVLDVQPLLGRRFRPDEGEPGAATRVVILSHGAWQGSFGGSAEILDQQVVINALPWTVVGVLPAGVTLAPEQRAAIDVWLPMGAAVEVLGRNVFSEPEARMFRVTARLANEATDGALAEELSRVAESFTRDYPDSHTEWELHADPLDERVVGRSSAPVVALLLGTLGIGVATVVNLAGLVHQRAQSDRGETAILRALGAAPSRLEQLRVTEAVMLGMLGGVLAVAAVHMGFLALRAWDPLELPSYVELTFGWRHALAGFGLSVTTALGVTAAVRPAWGSPGPIAREPSRGRSPARRGRGLAMLGLQVAMSAFLTVGAIAAARSLYQLRAMHTGISSDGLLSGRMEVPSGSLPTDVIARRTGLLVDALSELPDVDQAFVWSPELPAEARTYTGLLLESMAIGGREGEVLARYHSVSPGAISAIGLRLVAGRDFSLDDRDVGRRVAAVSASAAVSWWGSERAALGQKIRRPLHDDWSEVVGVVADAPFSGRYGPGSDNDDDVFFMFEQDPRRTINLFARSWLGGIDQDGVRGVVASVMPELPLYDVRWMDDRLRDQERIHRSMAGLGMLYALGALLLTAVGLAGSSLVWVGQRRREMGVRQALGATPTRALIELVRGPLVLLAAGVALGGLLARVGLSLVDPLVLTVGPDDPVSHIGMAVVVGGCGVLALLVPAASSLRLAPTECLKGFRP